MSLQSVACCTSQSASIRLPTVFPAAQEPIGSSDTIVQMIGRFAAERRKVSPPCIGATPNRRARRVWPCRRTDQSTVVRTASRRPMAGVARRDMARRNRQWQRQSRKRERQRPRPRPRPSDAPGRPPPAAEHRGRAGGARAASCSTTTSCTRSSPLLKVEDFYRDTHQIIYRAIRDLYDLGKAIDVDHPGRGADPARPVREVGGDETLAEILNSVPHAANAKYYAEIVRQKSSAAQLIESANEILRDGYSNNSPPSSCWRSAERGSSTSPRTRQGRHGRAQGRRDQGDGPDRRPGRVDGHPSPASRPASSSSTTSPAVSSRAQLVILAARPSMGKTALALNICDHVAVNLKIPVLFVSLEMGQLELAERLLCSRSRVDGHKLRTGQNWARARWRSWARVMTSSRTGAAVHRRHPRAEHAPDHRQRPPAQAPPEPRPDRGRLHPAHRLARSRATAGRSRSPRSAGGSRRSPAS